MLLDVLLTKLLSTGRARDTCGVTRALPLIKARARGRVSLYHGPGSNIVLIYRNKDHLSGPVALCVDSQ